MKLASVKQSVKSGAVRAVSWCRDFMKRPYAYLLACFFIPLGIMLLIHLCHGIHPIANGSVLVLDLNGQYVYFYEALREFIYGDTCLLYSFSRALGGEFLGIYAYYIASPLSWLVALFPKGKMLEALLFIFLLKTGLCGFTMGWYLHKNTRRPLKPLVCTFATLYALCSYAIVHQHNSMWIDALFWLPVITYSVEQLIKHGSYKLFILSVALTILSNFYIGYMVCIYVVLYFFFYFAAHKDINPHKEPYHFPLTLGRIGGAALLAVGISAVMLLGAYYALSFGKDNFSSPDWSFFTRFTFADLFVKFLPGSYDSVRPVGLPFVYCGVLTLVAVPLFYLNKKISTREKVLSTVLVGIFVLSFMINPVDLVWHGFQKPNWLNYRYSFILCFFLLTLAYKGMQGIRKVQANVVFTIGMILITATVILQKFEFDSFLLDETGLTAGQLAPLRTVAFTVIATIAICAVLAFMIRAKHPRERRKAAAILLIVICVETFANGFILTTDLDMEVSFSSYSSYNSYIDTVRDAAEKVQEMDTSFYRMEKIRQRKTNDNMALGMRGLSCSTSTLNQETILFLHALGYTSYSHRSKYMGETPLADSLLGVRYILAESTVSESRSYYNEDRALDALMRELYTVYTETPYYVAYQNPYALSLAFTVSSAARDLHFYTFPEKDKNKEKDAVEESEELILASPFERLNALVAALVGEEDLRVFYPVETQSLTYANCRKGYTTGHTKYSVSDSAIAASVTFEATAPADGYLFFYAPSEYRRETKMTVNGKSFGDFMAQDSDRIKTIGKFSEGEVVDVTLTLQESNYYLMNDQYVLYYMDVAAYQYAMNCLAQEQFEIESFTETHFEGTITTSDEKETVLTTIPYDEGWKVYVDGERVEIFKVADALIGFEIDSRGAHTLELRYAPRTVLFGAAVSLGSALIFAAIVTKDILAKRKRAKAATTK